MRGFSSLPLTSEMMCTMQYRAFCDPHGASLLTIIDGLYRRAITKLWQRPAAQARLHALGQHKDFFYDGMMEAVAETAHVELMRTTGANTIQLARYLSAIIKFTDAQEYVKAVI